MEFLAGATGFLQAGAGIFGAFQQRSVDKARVNLQYEDNLEKIRRRSFTQQQTLGETKAGSEASGVLHTGGSTAQGVIDSMSDEFKKELNWMKQYASKARRLGMTSAKVGFETNLFGSVAQGASTYAGMV